jgi:hypothetical protein
MTETDEYRRGFADGWNKGYEAGFKKPAYHPIHDYTWSQQTINNVCSKCGLPHFSSQYCVHNDCPTKVNPNTVTCRGIHN